MIASIYRIEGVFIRAAICLGAIALCASLISTVTARAADAPAATKSEEETKPTSKSEDTAEQGTRRKKQDDGNQQPSPDAKKPATEAKTTSNSNAKAAAAAKPVGKRDAKHTAASKREKVEQTTKQEKPPIKKVPKKVRLAMLTLKDSIPENLGQEGPFGEVLMDLRETIKRLDKAAKDTSVSGLVLDIQSPDIGRGKIAELRGAIARFRASGKKIYAMMDSAMPADYLVACACDEIVMPESGELMLPGIHAEAMFYKGLLAKVGIEADFIHMGDYKGAAEPMTRERFSEPVRENMNSLIDSLYDEMVTTIVKDRPLSIAQAKEVIDTGLISAKRAKELKLIDRVAYGDELRKGLAEQYEAESVAFVKNYGKKEVDTDFSGPMGFVKLMQTMMGGSTSGSANRGKKIAVVYAVGPITTGKSESDLFGDQTMGSTTIVEALREANRDNDVVAIVLRIDSPGGSALASDLIWHETQVIEKPIVASMGDVAGSGGYYIAMGADKIIAAPGTVTGSIGVVGGKMAITGLYAKLGITTETIERGKNSGLFSSSGKFTDSQRAAFRKMMEETYADFTTKAAQGRKMPVEKLCELARGRVYSGRQAKEIGLVDELGTLHDAVVEAKKLAGLAPHAEVQLEVLPEPTNFFESLFGNMEAEREARFINGVETLAPEVIQLTRKAARLRKAFDRPTALVMPFDLDIR
ncbi:MAG: signal peptide peptidase SppA [Pirellulales bacterium]|nr:signal peptide peptidase SppA [Pirellulales bacterium]